MQKKEPKGAKAGRKTASTKFAPPSKQKQDVKKPDAKSPDQLEQVEELERIMAFGHLMPTVDPWGQPTPDTLGGFFFIPVSIPRDLNLALFASTQERRRTS